MFKGSHHKQSGLFKLHYMDTMHFQEKYTTGEKNDQPYKSQIRWLGRDVKEKMKKKEKLPLEEHITCNIEEEEIYPPEQVSERRVLEQYLPVEEDMDVQDPYEGAQGREAVDDLVLASQDFSSEDIAVMSVLYVSRTAM